MLMFPSMQVDFDGVDSEDVLLWALRMAGINFWEVSEK